MNFTVVKPEPVHATIELELTQEEFDVLELAIGELGYNRVDERFGYTSNARSVLMSMYRDCENIRKGLI